MTGIDFLKKAALADSLGKFRLADNYYQKAVRLAEAVGSISRAAIEALEKAGLESAEKIALESGTAKVGEVLEAQAARAIDKLIIEGDAKYAEELLRLSGIAEADIAAAAARLKGLTGDARELAIKRLAAKIEAENGSLFKLEPAPPGPGPGPGPVPPSRSRMDFSKLTEAAKQAFSTMGPAFKKIYLEGPMWGRFVKFLTTIGAGWEIYQGGIRFFNLVTGATIPVKSIINGFGLFEGGKPSNETGEKPGGSAGGGSGEGGEGAGEGGSGEAGSGVYQDPTTAPGFNYTSKEDMYERRMKAKLPGGKFQQTLQGEKAQKFVDENKSKYKTQREFLDAAKAAGDANFANSVIALVKKDLDLPVSAEDPRKF